MTKHRILLILIIFTAVCTRFLFLDTIPNGLTGDEMTYAFTPTVVAHTGTDINGTWRPWQTFIFQYPKGEHQAELPYLITLPFIKFFGNSLFFIRFPYAVMGVLIVLTLYLLSHRLFNGRIALATAAFAAMNPWLIFMSRTLYESTPATLFFLISLYLLLEKEMKHVYLALPFLFLSFYSYIGTKFILIPYVLLATGYSVFISKKQKMSLPHVVIIGSCVIITAFFLITQKYSDHTRMGELFLPTDNSIQQLVDTTRRLTIQNPLTNIVVNKITVYIWTLIGKLFAAISPTYLFFEGDLFFSLWHGLFYVIDFIFICVGSIHLLFKNKQRGIFLFSLTLLSLTPQLFHKTLGNFSSHITMMVPFLIIISAYGFIQTILLFRKHSTRVILLFVGLFSYLIFAINFFHTYFFRYPIQGYSEFHVRTLIHYIESTKKAGGMIIVQSPESYDLYRKFLFYSNSITKQNLSLIKTAFQTNLYHLTDVSFESCSSPDAIPKSDATIVVDARCGIPKLKTPDANISRLSDAGTMYAIYNDTVCSSYGLHRYPSNIKLNDFNVEKLTDKKFCETFITRY